MWMTLKIEYKLGWEILLKYLSVKFHCWVLVGRFQVIWNDKKENESKSK